MVICHLKVMDFQEDMELHKWEDLLLNTDNMVMDRDHHQD